MEEKKIYPEDQIKRMPQSRKIRIPRWCTRLIAEYEIGQLCKFILNQIDNKFWMSTETKSDTIFYPFSAFVYLSNKSIMIMGGLNDGVKTQKHITSKK